ncbi:hypothetical protein GCM10027592_46890 [Spirosoma flavus]
MESIINTYQVKVVREPGYDPSASVFYDYAEQEFEVEATSILAAYLKSEKESTLPFRGQLRKTFINGKEYFDERY